MGQKNESYLMRNPKWCSRPANGIPSVGFFVFWHLDGFLIANFAKSKKKKETVF